MDETTTGPVDTDTDTTIPAAETPTQTSEIDNQGEPSDADETPDADEASDVFPRSVVEKLRRESAGLRDRVKTAEDRLSAMQRQAIGRQITAAGMRPEAVFAVAQLDDLLADDGTVDTTKVSSAMAAARETLGIDRRRHARPGMGELNPGHGVRDRKRAPGFEAAFGPRQE
ncbi:hypothetical protein ACXDF8_26335 [Mycolicibacterium sp. CBM1]